MCFKILLSAFALTFVLSGTQCFSTKWITVQSLGDDVADKSSHETLLKELTKKNLLELTLDINMELYVLSSGNQFYGFGGVDNVNQELLDKAIASMNLYQKVHAVDKVFPIMFTAVIESAIEVKKTGDIKNAVTLALNYFENRLKEEEPVLYSEYCAEIEEVKKHKSEVKPLVYMPVVPATEAEADKIFYQMLNHPLSKKTMAHSAFRKQFQHGPDITPEGYKLAKAMQKVAINLEKRNAVQTVYEAGLYETVKKMGDLKEDDPVRNYKSYRDQLLVEVVKVLESKFKADPIGADVEEAKKNILL